MMDIMARVVWVATSLLQITTSVASTEHRPQNDDIGRINEYVITSIYPESGPTTGGTDVLLRGEGRIDGDELMCLFGNGLDNETDVGIGAYTVAQWVSPNEIKCTSPEWNVAGANVSLSLESDGTQIALSPSRFHYYEPPIVQSIYPTSGATLGGTTIALRGSGFLPFSGMICRLGMADLPATWKGFDEVVCTSPSGAVDSSHVLSLSLNGVDFSPSPAAYRYTEPPLVKTIWPTRGSVMGGTVLALTGQGFEDSSDMKCIFWLRNKNSRLSVEAEFISPTQMECRSPAVEKPTQTTVHVTTNGVDASANGVIFHYIDDAVLSSVKPASGPVSGGTWVSLTGSKMSNGDSLRCRFGESPPVPGYWISHDEIQCISPRQTGHGLVNVTADYLSGSAEFLYYKHPTISTIYPSFGSSIGGTLVTVRGTGFLSSSHIMCRFGAANVVASYIDEEELTCVSPPGHTGSSHSMVVSLNGVDFSPSFANWTYKAPVEVHSVSPKWADEAGGAMLKVLGSGFEDTDGLECIFARRQVNHINTQATYVSTTELRCAAPPLLPTTAPSEVSLRVTINGIDVSSSHARLQYMSHAIVSTMDPAHGTVIGGTSVLLTGSGFLYEETSCCRFGDTIVPAESLSWTLVRCYSPPSSAGDVVMSYSNDGINFVNAASFFSFTVPATVSSIAPNAGPERGGTKIHIFGEGFTDDDDGWKCLFNETSVTATFYSPSEINCRSPASFYGESTLKLIQPDGHIAKAEFVFYYYEELQLISVSPESSPISGGTPIMIKVRGLQIESSYTCIFGGSVEASAKTFNSSFIECITPQWYMQEGTTLVVKSVLPAVISSESMPFDFYHPPTISSASPSSFYSGFSTDITVRGEAFFNSDYTTCRLGKQEAQAQWISENEIVCHYARKSLEPHSSGLTLLVSANGVDFHDSGFLLSIHPDLTVLSLSPNYGSMSAGTRSHVTGTGFVSTFVYRCLFGTKFVDAVFQSPNEIICDSAPPYLPGRKPFSICVDGGGCIGGEDLTFEYLDHLQLIDASPMEGSISGGTPVHIKSNHPLGSESACSFGNQLVKIEAFDEDLGVGLCKSPPYAGEPVVVVDFAISSNGQEFSYKPFQFVYSNDESKGDSGTGDWQYAVQVSHIYPVSGLPGSNITVVGSGFERLIDAACKFGSKQVPVISVCNTSMICTTPWNGRFERVSFNVMDSSAKVFSNDDNITFTYVETPRISRVAPAVVAKTNMSTTIEIEGHNFDILTKDSLRCRVGLMEATARVHNSSASAVCTFGRFPDVGSFPVELLSEQFGVLTSSYVKIQVMELPRLTRLEPPMVVADNRDMGIMVKGENFANHNLTCVFDHHPSEATFISDLEVFCFLPKEIKAQIYQLRISNGGLDSSQFLLLEAISPPSIADVIPSKGQSEINVTITGKSFHPQMRCQFGNQIVKTLFHNSTSVQCVAPPSIYQESVPVALTLDGVPISTGPQLFFTFIDLTIESISPRFGEAAGGTPVIFNMKEDLLDVVSHCIFGGIIVPVSVGPSELVCVSPPMPRPGPVHVGVSVDGNDVSMSELIFQYTMQATFQSLHPSRGSESGGTVVTLTGSSFVDSDMVACYFGDIEVPGRLLSDESLVCETPMMRPGYYQVNVTLNAVDTLPTNQSFEVHPRMTTLFSLPSFGETGGGTNVLVYGTNFVWEDLLSCRFGGVTVDARYIGSNMIECFTPPWEVPGLVDLAVVSSKGDIATVDSGFTFYTSFNVSSIDPNSGFLRGGTHVSVKGSNFSRAPGNVECVFGDTAVKATVVSDDQISCRAPPVLLSGHVEFGLSHGSDKFSFQPGFEYEDEIILDTVSPMVVSSIAERLVTVHGFKLKNRKELGCVIGPISITVEATFISDYKILCHLPMGLQPGVYDLSITMNGHDYSEATTAFSVIDPFLLKSIYPRVGSTDTVPVVTLEGNNFQDVENLACLVDEKYVVASDFVNKTTIKCPLPINVNAGDVSIALTLDGVPISTGPPLFFTFIDLSITSIRPTFGAVTGGTRVVFNMKEKLNDLVSHCIFGEFIVPISVGSSELVCVSPPMSRVGPVRVGVSANGMDFSNSHVMYQYTKPAAFSDMYPTSGSETGGTVVTLIGSNFVSSNQVACYFGNTKIAGRWLSDEELVCITPSMKPGNYKVRVTINGVDTLRTSWQFTFFREIDILYASPSGGSILGGTEVSIIGKSFAPTENLTCKFGEWGRTRATFFSPNKLSCLSPDISKEISSLVDVGIQVSLNGVDFSPATAPFQFTPPAAVYSIFPDQGSFNGGTQVTVRGTSMFPSTASNTALCIFGNETVSASVVSTEQVTCISPPHYTDGDVFFAISLNGVDLVHNQNRFFYLPNAKTVSIEPNGGPFTGGTLVTAQGIDFGQSSARCKFGSSYSDGIVYISDQIIQCIAPPHPLGTVDFAITTEGGENAPSNTVFEFYRPPTILFSSPTSGPHSGGTIVRIYGRNFRPNVEYVCYVGSAKVLARYTDSDSIECTSPRIRPDDDEAHVPLMVAEKYSNFTANTLSFSYVPFASLDYLRPQYVFFDGGDRISIFGSYLNSTSRAWCRFMLPSKDDDRSYYYKTVEAVSVSDHGSVDCQVPSYPFAKTRIEAFVEVSTNSWDWSSSSLAFTYAPKPMIHSIQPLLGTVNGGNLVTVHGSGFLQESNLRCAFGETGSILTKWISHEEISCLVPAVPYPVNVTLSLHFQENTAYVEGLHYTYHRELSLEEAFPIRGFIGGGTAVIIQGTGFLDVPTLSCRFGSLKVPATFISMNSIKCLTPHVNKAQDVELSVSLNGIEFSSVAVSSRRHSFQYDEEIDLFRTIPSNVPVLSSNGRDYISVIGSSFINTTTLSCRFGQDQTAVAEYVSDSKVKCILPEVTEAGNSEVRISLNGVDFSRKYTMVALIEPALISKVTPQRMQEGSMVDVLVKGENFVHSTDLQCRFGKQGHLWSAARWINGSLLKCRTPPLNLTYDGVEYIGVSNNGGYDKGRQLFALEVVPRAQFLSMHPAVGYIDGGTEVTITLGNVKYMGPDLMCQFATEASPAKIISANKASCVSPPYRPSEIMLKLVSNGAQILAAGAFRYLPTPYVESLHPTTGPLEGSTAVTMYGSGLANVTHCRFDLGEYFKTTPANVESDFSVTCKSPTSDENVDAWIELTHNGQNFVRTGHRFGYRANPRLFSLAPSYGGDMGGKAVFVRGENFIDMPTMCRFGTSLAKAIYISPTLLSCIAPELTIGLVPVSITLNGIDFITDEMLIYESIKLPQIESVEPALATLNNGNTTVILSTTALREDQRLACHFGVEHRVSASYISPHSASCLAPIVDVPKVVNVSISVDGQRYLADGMNSVEFNYVAQPVVQSISPTFGWTTRGGQALLSVKDLGPFRSHELSCSFGDSNNYTKALHQPKNSGIVGIDEYLVSCHVPRFRDGIMKQHAPIVLRISDGKNNLQIKTPVFTYLEPAIVTKINPPIGSVRGGSIVRVSGINFSNIFGLECLFGETSVEAEFINDREIHCTSPEWKGGRKTVHVGVGIKGGAKLTVTSHASFAYQSHPTIQSMHPKFGNINGGTNVTMSGNALKWPEAPKYLSCRFGNSSLVPVLHSPNDGELVCMSPPLNEVMLTAGERRAVSVSVYANHGQLWLASSDDQLVYANHIEVESLSPKSGPLDGGTTVSFSARGLDQLPMDEITCHFGHSTVPASYFQVEDILKCVSPPIDGSLLTKTVMMNLGINGLRDVTSIGKPFTYYGAPSVVSIFPTFGFFEGGEDVFISGRNFRNEKGLGCKFDEVISPKVVWLSDTSIICTSPVATNKSKTVVAVRVTNNGMDYTDGDSKAEYSIAHRPGASKVEPDVAQWEENTSITITGKNLIRTSACQFGGISQTYPTFNVTENQIQCMVPPATDAPLQFLPQMSHSKIPITIHLENGKITTGLEIEYVKPSPKVPDPIKKPQITSILPNHGSSAGGDWIQVYGSDFFNTENLRCKFGESLDSDVHFISPNEVRCRTPRHLPGTVSFGVINSASEENQYSAFNFTFRHDLSVLDIHPRFGSVSGGTRVHIFGSFPSSSIHEIEVNVTCKFGMGGVVLGELVSQNEIACNTSPPSSIPETVELRVSFDGGQNYVKSSSWFSYGYEEEIESLIPSYGPVQGGTSIVVLGRNFKNSTGLQCVFGEISVSATFLSTNKITCTCPPKQRDMEDKVAVRLASVGGVGSSWIYFEYIERPEISSFSPRYGDSSFGEAEVSVLGIGFRNVLQMMCVFGTVNVQATVVDSSEILCQIPRHPPGVVDFRLIDRYALFTVAPMEGAWAKFHFVPEASVYSVNPSWNVTQAGSIVFARGTNFNTSDDISCEFGRAIFNATVMTESLLLCQAPFEERTHDISVAIGLRGSLQSSDSPIISAHLGSPTAPNGTTMDHNITLCNPGTFQPQNGQRQCLQCPIGFICPLFGLSKPILCPAGSICERLGLVTPSSPCVSGHYCNRGTKMSSQIAQSTTETWILDDESGVLTIAMSNSPWEYVPRAAPATGERRIFHPPVDDEVKAEQPFPCPIGFFCGEGVSSAEHHSHMLSDGFELDTVDPAGKPSPFTPQPCEEGYFCPRGSSSPKGTGACPGGFYCPTQILAIPCEIGHYCPGTANISPIPCFPGSYSSEPGQSSCKLCEVGTQCPGFGKATPELCEAGWVCDIEGLSTPFKRCPSGFVCGEGTTTDDPNTFFGVPPRSCPQGSFCLEGVAHSTTMDWLPSFEMGALAPQPCQEGYYCPSNSSTPVGGGKCWPGHYCPENSPYPIQTPPGAFAGEDGGAIVGSLSLPGTFSPRPGQIISSPCPSGSECLSYGTYVPRICGPGTYRSKADSTQCKPCPERTYSFASGLTDISQCLPCAEGRVCGSQGMIDLKQSDVCSEGNVCGYMTDRVSQFANQCPSGSYCGNETTTLNQYSSYCLKGSYCERGTTSTLRTRDKCGRNYYCTSGTPNPEPYITRCPRQTTSLAGAKDMDHCSPSLVAICDKMPFSETNPFDRLSYYPLGATIGELDESAEMLVIKKILQEDLPNVLHWKNDTLEVFRTCPAYGVLPEPSSDKPNELTVIGRNFRNSTTLTCRYRICHGFSWETASGTKLIVPGNCQNETSGSSNLSEYIMETGAFISRTRVACPVPTFEVENDFQSHNQSTELKLSSQVCMRDGAGQMFLSQTCSDAELASGHCAFEDSAPSLGLRKRIYSLFIACSEDENSGESCGDITTAAPKLNPCLTQRIIVDISNNGEKFSGETTIVPYSSQESVSGASSNEDSTHQVLSSHAVYEFVLQDSLDMLQLGSTVIEKKHLVSSFNSDAYLCRRSLVHEEGRRLEEEGWFESPYMSRFHLSFDWRHLPSHLVYNEHYKLAIYVVPSRCHESKCNEFSRGHSYKENIPCLQPVELPVWFTDETVDKNQVINMTLTSLDDSRFRVEIQIINGLALPVASFFKRTMSVLMERPQRANTSPGMERRMSPFVSWEEKGVDNPKIFGVRYDEGHSQKVSLPRNLPPRWKRFERGRALIGMNATYENSVPTIKDGNASSPEGTDFWDNPYQSAKQAKLQSDIYFETFHGVSQDGHSGSYKYEHGSLILPYLPYFSNCREFDSHVPLWALVESATQCRLPGVTEEFPNDWWRREIPPLPHQDDVKAIGPSDFMRFYPVADWCERNLHCNFEEDLPKPDVTPRWFEAESGTVLFSMIRDPIDYYQYTGRESSTVGKNDGGGQKFIDGINTLQTFIPAKVDRSSALNIEGGCATACFPRKVTVDISYHQVDVYSKRIVQINVLYDKFDKDVSNDNYELKVNFYALNYQELVIKFAFSRGLFLLLFTQIGVGTVIAAFIYWAVVRLTTNLERPPSLRITGFLYLTFPPALVGFTLGILPIAIVTAAVFYLMKGYLVFTPDTDPEGRRWLFPSSTRLHYSDVSIDPDNLQATRQGRTGLAFLTMALISFYFTTKMFVPNRSSSGDVTDQQGNARALINWKRGNLICSSVIMSLFLVIIVEWSFWGSFGTYIWEAIIGMKLLSIFVGSVVDKQLGEALLSAPVMTSMGLVQGIVTMSANDFMDFLLSYIVGFGFLILERMYVGPLQAEVFGWVYDAFNSGLERLHSLFGSSQEKATSGNLEDASLPEENNETVEPLLGSYASYSCDTLSLLYTPFIMLVIMAFRDEAEITKLYGIKEDDMEYYVLFALAIIPFQIIADILLHNALELLHGWKMHEYLEYCRVRFQQREVWWKGLETNTLDVCIEESLQSMDQQCFSSQYYMLNTIHVSAMIYFVLGVEMMARAKYTVFGDPAMFPIIASILLCSMGTKLLLTSIARMFGLWRIKHEKRRWHSKVMSTEANPNIEQWEDVQVDHDQHVMEQRITDQTFRYKFLNYNRSWILSQLPDMLTPRITANQRPYMINQFARILGQVNGDISSDSDSDDEQEFHSAPMTSSTRTLARTWLMQANRRLRLKKLVQPLIQQSKGTECQICLSRNLLQVESLHSIEDIDEQFKSSYGSEEIDQVLFKRFWQRNQRYQTICLPCIQRRNGKEKEQIIQGDLSSDENSGDNLASDDLTQSSEAILASWYAAAKSNVERRLS